VHILHTGIQLEKIPGEDKSPLYPHPPLSVAVRTHVLILKMYLTSCRSENFHFIILLIGSAGVMLTQQGHEEIAFSRVGGG